ncbi:hypothetical protein APUTEX25_003982, partial [Auxenochlorella protothecoides]
VAEGAGEADPSVWIVQEFCDGGTLYDAIDRWTEGLWGVKGMVQRGGGEGCGPAGGRGWLRQGYDGFAPADVRAVLRTLCEVASALAHLHALGVVHGDLTGSNVLLCSAARAPDDGRGWHAKVSDFGLARELPAGGVLSNVRIYGTVSHMPPEVLMSGHLTLSADVYALGVLLYEMYEGARAWKGMRASQVLYQVATQGRGLEPSPWAQGDALGADVQALMRECLAPSPRARPSARQVLARSEALLRGMSAGGVEPLPEAVPPLAAHQTDPDFQLDWTPCLASMPDQVEAAEDPNVLAVAAARPGTAAFTRSLVRLVALAGGYDIGVTGGVTAMASFQEKFFPEVYARTVEGITDTSPYCKLLGSSVVNHAVLAQLNGGPAGASTLVGATDTSLVVISLATSGSSAVLCQQHLPFVVLGLQATPMGHTQDAICMLADAGFVEIMAYDAEANRLVTLVRHALAGPTLNPWVHLAAARGRGVVAVASVTQQIAVLALTGPGSGVGGDWALQPLAWGGMGVDDVIAGLALTDSGEWLAVLSLVGPDSQELHSAALDAGAASARRGAPLPRLAFQLDAEWFAQDAWIWGLHPGPPSRPHTLLLRYESCAMLCAPRRGQRAAVLAHYRPYWAGGTRLWGHAAVAGLAWQPGGEALYLASFDGRLSLAGGPAASVAPACDGAVPVFTGRPKRVDAEVPGEVHALLLPAAEGPFVWLASGGGVVVAANRTDRPLIPGGLGPVAGASLGLEEGRPLLWAVGQAATEGPLAHVTQVRVAESAAPGAGGDENGRPPWVLNGAWPYPTGDARERVVLSFGAGTCVKLLTGGWLGFTSRTVMDSGEYGRMPINVERDSVLYAGEEADRQ